MLALVTIIACVNNKTSMDNKKKVLLIDTATGKGFGADMVLPVVAKQSVDDSIIYTLQATYKNKFIGFKIIIPQSTATNEDGFGEGIVIKSTGESSDNFRNALAELYKLEIDTNKKFVNGIAVEYVDMMQYVKFKKLGTAENDKKYFKRLKLFFGEPDENEAQIVLNIDKEQNNVELLEKDTDYRSLLVDFLTQK